MPVREDAEGLLKHVLDSDAVPDSKSLSLAYLPPGVFLRPVEALHLLSLVTAHAYSADDLHDAYAWWGLLRYLGFFDHEAGNQVHPTLRVSHAGAQVTGVQRRVTSEELGIAFGVLLASMRLRDELGPGVPVGIVDVDVLLRGSHTGSSRRPDYLLVAGPGETAPDGMAYFLECKGTSDPRKCGQQLTTAVQQITGPVLGYSAQAGLAVSTVAGATQVSCVALELTDSDAEESEDSGDKPRHVLRADPAEGVLPGLTDTFVPAALRSSWFMLGYYAGNETAVRRWSGEDRKPARIFASARERHRVRFESEYGPAVGITTAFDLGDRQLVVTWGIDQHVDDALAEGNPRDVLAAQEAFARELDEITSSRGSADEPHASADSSESEEQLTSGEPIRSLMPDGSIFSLTVR
jgi:hypothetical protein